MSIEVDIRKRCGRFSLDTKFYSEGGMMGLLGASGCGKSLTLRCVAGVIRPDEGRIVLNGRTVFDSAKRIDLPPQRRRVGYLFQNYALFPNMTVAENIACGLTGKKSRKKEAVEEAIRAMRLNGLEDLRPHQLSGGQQQRTALARILIGKPEILLLDEPFSALDSFLKEQLLAELKELLAVFGKDTIIVSHSRDEIYELCPEIAIMGDGRIIESGQTKDIFRDPSTEAGAVLTGCKNIMPAEKIGETRIRIPEWGVSFDTGRNVPDDIRSAGIRAHYFGRDIRENVYPVRITEKIEGHFAWIIKFRYPEQAKDTPSVWWMISKGQYEQDQPVARLGVMPEDILLLQ